MNNQRRHQLEQNVLANYTGNGIGKFLPLMKPLALAALVAILGFVAYNAYQAFTTKSSAAAWTEYYFNLEGDAESFAGLADRYGSAAAGQWSRFSAGTGYLNNGIEAIYTNRQEGVESIRKAIAEFEVVKASRILELRLQALRGLAQAHESLGELSDAIGYYEQLLGESNLSEGERDSYTLRVASLKSPEIAAFYDWFAKLDPKPVAPPAGTGDLSSPPTSPTITFDPANPPELPNLGTATSEPTTDTPPATVDTPPVSEPTSSGDAPTPPAPEQP